MSYCDKIAAQVKGKEKTRQRGLLSELDTAFKKGGADALKRVLEEKMEQIQNEFDEKMQSVNNLL